MRRRFAGQLVSILSFSLQGDTTERLTAFEREIPTYERDSGKVLDDEIKIETFLLRLPQSQLKTHLLVRVTLKKWTDFRLRSLEQSPTLDVKANEQRNTEHRQGSKRRRQTKQSGIASMSKMRKHGSHFRELPSLRQDVQKVRNSRSPGESVSIFWNSEAQGKGGRQVGQGRQECRHSQNVLEFW